MDSKTTNFKNKILNLIPTGNFSEKDLIVSFEKINAICKLKNNMDLFQISNYLYTIKDKNFDKLNNYFKKVHALIRKKAIQSKHYSINLEAICLNNFNENSGFYFGKKQMEKAYSKLLDMYDPNKYQNKKTKEFNWNGFWSLISTHNGIISVVALSDTMDREFFYDFLR